MDVTPCGVLYQAICEAAGTKRYEEVDARIISRTFLDGKGRSPYDRILRAPSFRTREIIQKDPHELDARFFRDAHLSCPDLVSLLKSAGLSNRQITDYFSGDATDLMTQSLRTWKYDYHVFRNCMNDITRNNDPDHLNTAVAVVMLFVITAFHGDPRESLPEFFSTLSSQAMSVALGTGLLAEEVTTSATATYPLLGLIRLHPSGRVGNRVYELNPRDEGTLIGRTEVTGHTINDVGSTVSRRHAILFRKDATWYVRGLESTNGTRIRRRDGIEVEVEPPAAKRPFGYRASNEPIHVDDVLLLGLDTEFRVVLIGHGL